MDFSKDNLTSLLALDFDKAITSCKAEVIAFYAYLFNEPSACTSCPSKLKEYWQKLHQNGLQILEQKQMKTQEKPHSKFRIKEGISFLQVSFGSSKVFNNDNITNELALEYLKENPRRIINFSKYPENWEEMQVEETQEKEVKAEKKAKIPSPKSKK